VILADHRKNCSEVIEAREHWHVAGFLFPMLQVTEKHPAPGKCRRRGVVVGVELVLRAG